MMSLIWVGPALCRDSDWYFARMLQVFYGFEDYLDLTIPSGSGKN